MSHHHRGAAIAEHSDKRDLVAQHIKGEKWKGIGVPGIVPAGAAAKPPTIGSDCIVSPQRPRPASPCANYKRG